MTRGSSSSASFLLIVYLLAVSVDATYEKTKIVVGAVLPHTMLSTSIRKYNQKLNHSMMTMVNNRHVYFNFTDYFDVSAMVVLMQLKPSPDEIIKNMCEQLLPSNISAVIYLTNSEVFGSNAASVQYFLQLVGYLGIPVIAWNADNIGLEQRISEARVLQLAPSIDHQVTAIFALLSRYSWYSFSVVTTQLGGHDDFVRAIRDKQLENPKYNIIDVVTLKNITWEGLRVEMEPLASSETRVVLLFSGREEANTIFTTAKEFNLVTKNYVWIVTQSVIGAEPLNSLGEYPHGLIGIHYNTSIEKMLEEIFRAVQVFGNGLELFVDDPDNENKMSLQSQLSCEDPGEAHWSRGEEFFRYMKNISIPKTVSSNIEFLPDGTLRYVELDILNLNKERQWDRIGSWSTTDGIEIKDITWPGGALLPPKGLPEKFNVKVTFMEEPPYLNLGYPDNETGECESSRAVKCRVAPESEMVGLNETLVKKNPKYYKCCSGFCIDLLEKFAQDLGFTYDLYRVEDGTWGVQNNGTWNGLIYELLSGKADIVVTSIKINSDRQSAVDFTVPFLETGIAIVVAKRTGIISPKAFLEPFDTISWLLILLISIQVAAFSIFVFEWLSPYGYDMKMTPPREHKFSLFRTYWLVWAILFAAAVEKDCPRGWTARFMSNVWAMFAVVFLAIYTANLAAFMITREEYYDLAGIEDKKLQNPFLVEPPFRFGTIPFGNTEAVLKRHKPRIYEYMRQFNRSTVQEGIKAVKTGGLHAFIYDATVLDYLVGQDDECRLLTVGSWYAMTGYGFALPKKSKYLKMFNKQMIEYREKGDLERLQRFWLQGACKPDKNKRNASNPLDINQFMSAFLLLGCGVLFTLFLLGLEHLYFRYVRKHLAKANTGKCFALVSLSMGKSLSFREAVFEAQDMLKHHRCRDPICDTQLWKAKHELDMARLRIRQLEGEVHGRSHSEDIMKPRDMTKNHVSTNESPTGLFYQQEYNSSPYRQQGTPKEVTEKETVL